MGFPVTYSPEPTKPSGGPTPGATALLKFAVGTFDVAAMGDEISSLGIYSPRDVCGNQWPNWKCKGSQHARGAAGDAGVPVQRPKGHPEGHRLADWLVTHHVDLGVQEVIWAGRRWSNQTKQWKPYTGRSDHFDHVHFALNAAGAAGLTLQQILAVWEAQPAPVEPPQEDDDMLKLIRTIDAGDAENLKVYAVGPGYARWITEEEYYAGNGVLWDAKVIALVNTRQRDVLLNDVVNGSGKR